LFDLPFEDSEAEPVRSPRRVYSVTELTCEVRALIEERFFEVWVEGELSNCKAWTSGHLFFTLKDRTAQIKAVMYRSALRYLRFKPEDGQRVLARGRVSVYEPKGEYQLVCELLEPHGLGARQLALEQLKGRLKAEGLFDTDRKRPLPALPRKIGVVTSLEGAAIRDIVKVLSRRYPNLHLVIRPARVQGEGAASDIARGLASIGRVTGVDVVIVGRGGGSLEDLWAFNEEAVVRAIARSPVPVISAVGHESDVTLADLAADVRAPTPSAAAELVVARKDEYCGRVDLLRARAHTAVRHRVQRWAGHVHAVAGRRGLAGWPARLALRCRHAAELTHDLGRLGHALVSRRERRFRALGARLDALDLRRRLAVFRGRLGHANRALAADVRLTLQSRDARLATLAGRLDSLSPLAVLGRGYALCWDRTRTAIIRDAAAVPPGSTVHVTLREGELTCEVIEYGRHHQGLRIGPG
jgi:exodeoxyribonuclease VII large subunit